jgi:hypothetical protein
MKHKTTVVLGLLVLANAGLWAAYLHHSDTQPAPYSPVAATPPVAPRPAPPPAPPTPAPEPVPGKIWDRVRSDDPSVFAANLRLAGAPEATVRLLVSGQLRERYLARQRELFGAGAPSPQRQAATPPESRDKLVALRTLAREQQELLRTLFGNDNSALAVRERQRRQYGQLADEKLDQLDGIQADYEEIAAEIRGKAGGLLLAAEREALELIEQEKRKDIAAILTTAEMEQFDLLSSPAARALRSRLAGFAPSEQEFRAIFLLQRTFDSRFPRRSGGGFDEAKTRDSAAAEQELEAGLRTALGEARYAEYRKEQDSGYRMATRIAERFGLPSQRAGDVYLLAQDTQTRLQALRNDRALAPEAALQALAALDRETNEKLGALLGPEGCDAYKQTSGGAWLRTMDRLVRPVAPAAVVAPAPAEPPGTGAAATPDAQAPLTAAAPAAAAASAAARAPGT